MAYQTAANVLVAMKRESTTGVAPTTVTGAVRVRITDSPGLNLKRATVESNEKRADGLRSLGRLGGKSVDGSYNVELSTGGAVDLMLEAIMRSTWSAATNISFASVTSVTIGTNEVVGNGDWVAQGIRVGDIFTVNNTENDDGINAQVIALTSGTISVPLGTFAGSTVDTAGTLTRLKKVISATTPTRYSHSVEQYDQDIDLSELFLGCRVVNVRLSFRPGQMATASFSLIGMDRTALAVGTSPYYTSPTLTSTLGLVADDSTILKDGVAVATFTGLDIEFQITAQGQPVIGSLVSPDIFDNDCAVSGQITLIREDFTQVTSYDAETEFELFVKLEEPSGTPPECLAIYLPVVKFSTLDAPVGGGDGAKIETLNLMVGPKTAATGYDGTIAVISSSAA